MDTIFFTLSGLLFIGMVIWIFVTEKRLKKGRESIKPASGGGSALESEVDNSHPKSSTEIQRI